MITPSFGLTATERVLPKLALDFTTASLDPRVTFTRTTDATHPATYVNSSGYVTSSTNNAPRFDYSPTTLVCKGLLIEESRANALTYSEDYTNAAWSKFQSSVTANATTSPAGIVNSCKVVEDNTNNAHTIYTASLNFTSGTAYTLSVFAKAAGRNYCVLDLAGGAFSGIKAYFNLTNGTVGTVVGTGGTFSVVDYGNGWYRCSMTKTATSTTTALVQFWLASADNVSSYQGDGTSGIYLWGAQLEVGAFATSYIPTTSVSLTRNADLASMTGTNFSDWFNATQGAFMVQAIRKSSPAAGSYPYLLSVRTDANNRMDCFQNGNTNETLVTFTSGVSQGDLQSASAIAANSQLKQCFAYKLNSSASSINAGTLATDSSVTVPPCVLMSIGNYAGTYLTSGWFQKIFYWPQRLTNAEVQSFSK